MKGRTNDEDQFDLLGIVFILNSLLIFLCSLFFNFGDAPSEGMLLICLTLLVLGFIFLMYGFNN